MRRYLLVEVRVGREDDIPTVDDWSAYSQIRDKIGNVDFAQHFYGTAEVGQVLELTDQGVKQRFAS